MISKDNTLDRKVLAILIALEAALFCNFYFREIAWYPPLHIDQSGFLTQTYQLEEQVLSKGAGALWKALCSKTNSTGLLLPIEGAFSGLLFGGTRLPQLVILFLAFGILQLVAFATAKAVWASRAYGYMVLGLILCQTTAWFWAGGLFDFRIDAAREIDRPTHLLGRQKAGLIDPEDLTSCAVLQVVLVLKVRQRVGLAKARVLEGLDGSA
jgi:hypothetical protein